MTGIVRGFSSLPYARGISHRISRKGSSPVQRRARPFTVALLGPDGAGKSTVGRRLPDALGRPASYLYMGVNLESSNKMLPTTRLLLEFKRLRGRRPDLTASAVDATIDSSMDDPRHRSRIRSVKLVLSTSNLIAEEWFRQVIVWRRLRRGEIVVLDRHFFFDYHDRDVAPAGPLPLVLRLHGFLLRRAYPRPELAIVLDAPGDVLFARKGESTPELLEQRRAHYLRLRHEAAGSAVVDATQPIDRVVDEVAEAVRVHDASAL